MYKRQSLLRALDPVSYVTAPLIARGRILGALTFAFAESRRRYRPADVELAQDLARRAALAIENARLYREAQAEISRRKRAEDVQHALLQISEAAHTAQDLPQLYRVIHEIIKGLIAAHNFYMALYDDQTALFSFPYYADEVDLPPEPRPLKRGVTEYVLKTGTPLLADLERIAELHRSGAVEQVGSPSAIWLGVPLTINGQTFGVMAVQDYHDAAAFGEEEQQILSFISEQVALAIERKRAESALRERESTLQAIVAASPDIIAVREMDGSVRQESPSVREVLGYEPSTPQQQRPFRFIHQDDRQGQMREFDSLVSGRVERSLSRYRYRHADGHWVTLESHRRLIRDADGLPAGVAAVTRDVSRQAELEEALRQAKEEAERANRAKSEFLSRMSHELRTPLNAILGFAELMEMDPATSPKQHERLKHIIKGGRHLLQLINEVLDIARIETGRLSLSPEPVAVADLVYEALDLTRPLASQRNVRLYVEQPEHFEHHVQADAQRLKQVLLNLLANGVKYNHDGGSVTVLGEERPDGAVRVFVRDTGPGIPEEQRDRLFTPFERLGAESSGVEGTGLGLAIAKRLVEAMGGSIGVESAVGEGSTFWVELPKADRPLQQFVADEHALLRFAAAAPERQATVLYIEDNLTNLELMEHVLAFRPGVRLLPAITGGLGLTLAVDQQPDLILLDLNLPDIQGDEILRRLRENPRTRETPVIVISADATEHQIQRLLAAGARAYLTKPLDVKRLLEVLEQNL